MKSWEGRDEPGSGRGWLEKLNRISLKPARGRWLRANEEKLGQEAQALRKLPPPCTP